MKQIITTVLKVKGMYEISLSDICFLRIAGSNRLGRGSPTFMFETVHRNKNRQENLVENPFFLNTSIMMSTDLSLSASHPERFLGLK